MNFKSIEDYTEYINKLFDTGLFKLYRRRCGTYYQLNGTFYKLKVSTYRVPQVYLAWVGSNKRIISFDEVLLNSPAEIQSQLLFNIDLFRF